MKEAPRIVPVTEPVSSWVLINNFNFCISPLHFILSSKSLDDGACLVLSVCTAC